MTLTESGRFRFWGAFDLVPQGLRFLAGCGKVLATFAGWTAEGGCPYVSFGALFFGFIVSHSFSVSSRPSAANSPAP